MAKQTKSQEQKRLHIELIDQLITLSASGFGLVAALAWNNIIQEFVATYVKRWLPEGSGLLSLLIYALIVTALAVIVTYQLTKVKNTLSK